MKRHILLALFFVLGVQGMAETNPIILSEQDPTMMNTNIRIVIRSGASRDTVDKAGLSNLYSELILRGTKKKSKSVFQNTLEKMGAALAVTNTHDTITFYGKVIKENTVPFLQLIGEALQTPAFAPKEFKALQQELIAEILHIKNNNNRLGGIALRKKMFAGTPMEKTLTGSLSSIKKLTLKDVKSAYERDFFKGNFVFAIATPVDEKTWKPEIEKLWKKFPPGEYEPLPVFEPKLPKKPTLVVVHKAKTSAGAVVFGQKGLVANDPNRYNLQVGNFSFGGEPLVARLFKVIRSELGWTYSIFSSYEVLGALSFQPGMFFMTATPSVEFTGKTLLKMQQMWRAFVEDGLKKDELTLSTESLVNSYPFEFATADVRLSKKIYHHLYGVPILSPEDFAKKINGVGSGDVTKSLQAQHPDGQWYIAVVADKDVIKKQLEEEQKELDPKDRLTISEVMTPDDLIQ